MRLEQLYYFYEISKTQSISSAAENLFISQPSLSNAISSLEKELNIKLLIRSKSGVKLTEQGFEFLQLAQNIIGDIEKIYNLSDQKASEPQITLFALPSIACSILPNVLTNYKQAFPQIQVQIHEDKTHQILKKLEQSIQKKGTFLWHYQ